MKRDKIISLRVNVDLLRKVQDVIDAHTSVKVYYGHKYYECDLSKVGFRSLSYKYSFADLFENALIDFLEKYNTCKK